MTDQKPAGEPQAGEPTTGQPTPPVTPPSESQPSAGSEVTLDSLIQRLDRIEQTVGKRQSAKDKAINNLQGEVTDLKGVIDRYTALVDAGYNDQDARFRMEVESYMKQNPQGLEQKPGFADPVIPADNQETPSVDPQVTLKSLGLPADDPEVTQILGQEGDPTGALIELKARRGSQPAPDRIVNTGGGTSPPDPDLMQQYMEEVAQHRGNVRMVSEIQAKYAKKGLNV